MAPFGANAAWRMPVGHKPGEMQSGAKTNGKRGIYYELYFQN